MFTVKADTKEFMSKMRSASAKFKTNLEERLYRLTKEEISELKGSHPYKDRTGGLTASIGWRPYGRLRVQVMAKQKYASYVELGTRPHLIQPRHAKFSKPTTASWSKLSVVRMGQKIGTGHLKGWKWKSSARTDRQPAKPMLVFQVDGRKVVCRLVHHPGSGPKWFMTQAARNIGNLMSDRAVRYAFKQAFRG